VVWLGIAEAMALTVDDLPMGFLGQWWHIVVVAGDEFHRMVVVGIEGVEYQNAVGVVVVLVI
jgi:hypothetical protein